MRLRRNHTLTSFHLKENGYNGLITYFFFLYFSTKTLFGGEVSEVIAQDREPHKNKHPFTPQKDYTSFLLSTVKNYTSAQTCRTYSLKRHLLRTANEMSLLVVDCNNEL